MTSIALPQLPANVTQIPPHSWAGPTYESGDYVLRHYCNSCTQQSTCGIRKDVLRAMGEDMPGWPEEWIPIRAQGIGFTGPDKELYLCTEYHATQMTLHETPSKQQAVDRLVTLLQKEK